jgi:preprotein translocase subunit Sec63
LTYEYASSEENFDPHLILGISQTTAFGSSEVSKAYRSLARKYHPDKASPEEKDVAAQKF